MAKDAGRVRGTAGPVYAAEFISRGPAGSRRRDRQRASEARRDEAGAGAALWQLLVGARAMAAVATGAVLGGEVTGGTGKRSLGPGGGTAWSEIAGWSTRR